MPERENASWASAWDNANTVFGSKKWPTKSEVRTTFVLRTSKAAHAGTYTQYVYGSRVDSVRITGKK